MVTGLCAGILGIVFLVVTMMVGMQRRNAKVSVGDGGDEQLLRAMRRQANFVETAPLGLLLMFLCELNVSDIFGAAPNYIYGIGGALVVGRICHAIGMTSDKYFIFRAGGMMLTLLAILVSSIMLMYQFATA